MSDYLKTNAIAGDLDLSQWLHDQAQNVDRVWLLAHALDGVIWGRFANGTLTTSHDADARLPALDSNTLLQCRIFGKHSEVMLWHNDHGWHTTTITDPADADDYFDQDQMLWGDHGEALAHGFTRLSDGSQGLCHAVPLTFEQPANYFTKRDSVSNQPKEALCRPVRLKVRHTLGFDPETNGAYITTSRLVNLYSLTKKEQDNEHVA